MWERMAISGGKSENVYVWPIAIGVVFISVRESHGNVRGSRE